MYFQSLFQTDPMPPSLRGKRAIVLVLGDLGRSPRMCNHAASLAEEGAEVHFVGYAESALPEKVRIRTSLSSKKYFFFSPDK